uniref:protein-serine/threonine phosphatase n=1 Tax=Meloidogyne floridensis TaxID=298350 RepID=A0A915P5L5_9BILA
MGCGASSTLRSLKCPLLDWSEIPRGWYDPPNNRGITMDLLWADPDPRIKGWQTSPRGCSYLFGDDVILQLTALLDIDMVVRAHQVVQDGYEINGTQKLVTIFSAPNYAGQFDNAGAVMMVESSLRCMFFQFPPTKRITPPPQAPPPNATPPNPQNGSKSSPEKELKDKEEKPTSPEKSTSPKKAEKPSPDKPKDEAKEKTASDVSTQDSIGKTQSTSEKLVANSSTASNSSGSDSSVTKKKEKKDKNYGDFRNERGDVIENIDENTLPGIDFSFNRWHEKNFKFYDKTLLIDTLDGLKEPVPGGVNIKTTKPFYPNLKSNFVFHPPISSKSSFPSKYSSYSSHQLSPPYNQRQKHNLPSLKKPWWPLLHSTFPPSPPLPQFIGPEKRTEHSASSLDSLTIQQLYKNTLNALCRLLPRLLRNLSYEECIVSGRKAARYIRPIIRKQSEQASEEDKILTNKVDQVNRWHKYRLKLPQSKTVKELIEPWYFSGLTKENRKIEKKNCGN